MSGGAQGGDGPLAILAPFAAVVAVLLCLGSAALLLLAALGAIPPDDGLLPAALGGGFVGGLLLWGYVRLDWGRTFRSPAGPAPYPIRANLLFGPTALPIPIQRFGTLTPGEDALALRYRTFHTWLFWGTYILMIAPRGVEELPPQVAAALSIGYGIAILLMLRTRAVRIPLASIHLAVLDDHRVILHHARERWGSETTLLLEKRGLRLLREALEGRIPMDVLPAPAKVPRPPRAPRTPPPLRPPRTTLDGPRVRQLDRALEDLDGMEHPRPPSPS